MTTAKQVAELVGGCWAGRWMLRSRPCRETRRRWSRLPSIAAWTSCGAPLSGAHEGLHLPGPAVRLGRPARAAAPPESEAW